MDPRGDPGAIAGQSISGRAPRGLTPPLNKRSSLHRFSPCWAVWPKADGRVSKAEIRFVEQLMQEQLQAREARTFAINIFNEAKRGPATFEAYARQFGEVFSQEPEQREMLLRLLVQRR